jgi:hypothetical protein
MLIDEKFFVSRTPVSVIAIRDGGEALLVRAILESLGAVVTLHLIGTPEDFLLVLEQGEKAAKYIVICGHGDERGIIFGEYAGGIDVTSLADGSMPAEAIAARVSLPDKIVVSTACATGSKAFGEAFVKGGVAAYIAPNGYPEGGDAALFVHLLFNQLLSRNASPQRALHETQRYDGAYQIFGVYP